MLIKLFLLLCAGLFLALPHTGLRADENRKFKIVEEMYLDKEDCDLAWRILWNAASEGSHEAFWELHNGILNGLMPPNHAQIGKEYNDYVDYIFLFGRQFVKKNKSIGSSSNIDYELSRVVGRLTRNKSTSVCKGYKSGSIENCIKNLTLTGILLSERKFVEKFNKLFGSQEKAVCISTIPCL